MGRTTKSLTNTQVDRAKPKAKEYNLADGGGQALRIKPSGSKLWIFNYSRPHTKKRTNLSLGSYPDVGLADARDKAKDARALLAKEVDPKEHKDGQALEKLQAHSNTLKHVASQWFEIKKGK